MFLFRLQFFVTIFLIVARSYVSGCYFADNYHVCTSAEELDAEADSSWEKVFVRRSPTLETLPRYTLRENSFIRAPNIVELNLNGLFSTIEPRAFSGLTKLDRLYAFDNDLENFSGDMFLGIVGNLRYIQLARDNIKEIPQGFFKHVPHVKIVRISNNDFRTIKVGVFNGTEIDSLYLQNNGIETIEPGALADMKNLRLLLVPGNRLTSFNTQSILGNSPSIYSITLSKNNIDVIPNDMLTGVPNLQQFLMQFNNVHKVEDRAFMHTPSLEFIELGNNALREFPKNLFPLAGMQNMKVLFLHNNQFTFLDLAMFTRLPKLMYLTITGNPFQCRCLKEIEALMEEKKVLIICTEDFYKDGRPRCLTSPISTTTCVYDVESNANLIQDYKSALSNYSKVGLVCNTDAGFAKGVLDEKEY